MVTVTMLQQGGRTIGFDSNGHANHGEAGEDIVCSAISALTQTCCLGLVQILGMQEGKHLACSIDEAEGIHCVLADDTRGERLDRAEPAFVPFSFENVFNHGSRPSFHSRVVSKIA